MTGRQFPELLTPAEVAAAFGVDPKTVARWAHEGRLHRILTPGGTGRYYRAEVAAILAGTPLTAAQIDALKRGELL